MQARLDFGEGSPIVLQGRNLAFSFLAQPRVVLLVNLLAYIASCSEISGQEL
jgi:hypothetical protein